MERSLPRWFVNIVMCEDDCPVDIDCSGAVDVTDLLALLDAWGTRANRKDIDGNGVVAVGDLLAVLSNWGPCPP